MSNIRKYMIERQKSGKIAEEDYDENLDDGFEEKLKTHKRRMLITTLSIIVIVLIAVVVIKICIDRRVYKDYSVKDTVELGDTYGCRFYEFGDFALRYSNDGITYINGNTTIWNQPFEMKNPLIDVCQNTVAIAESGGTSIYIYNKSGAMGQGQITARYPIVSLDVSSQGVVAVVTKDDKSNYIEVYDKNGTQLVAGKADLSGERGYPVDLGISEDGTKMIASFLHVDGSSIETNIVFYNFSEVGKNEIDRIVGVYSHYGSTIIPRVKFINNNTAVAFGDNIFTIYSMKQKPSKIYEEEIDEKVKSIFYSEKYVGLILKTDEPDTPYRIKVVSAEGKECLDKKTDLEYTGVKFDDKNVILYNENKMQVISFAGVVKYSGEFGEEVSDVLTTTDTYTYLIVTSSGIKKIQLK